MKYREIIDEYVVIPPFEFDEIDFSKGKQVGKITTKIGQLQVWEISGGNQVAYGAIQYDRLDPRNSAQTKSPLGVVGFLKTENFWIAIEAYTKDGFQQNGICSELMYFVVHFLKKKVISDVKLTDNGEALWNSLIKSKTKVFNPKIIYLPTKETFELSEIDKSTTSNGTTVISPKDDNKSDKFYDEQTPDGQKFFYLIESKIPICKVHNSNLMFENILQPYPNTDWSF